MVYATLVLLFSRTYARPLGQYGLDQAQMGAAGDQMELMAREIWWCTLIMFIIVGVAVLQIRGREAG